MNALLENQDIAFALSQSGISDVILENKYESSLHPSITYSYAPAQFTFLLWLYSISLFLVLFLPQCQNASWFSSDARQLSRKTFHFHSATVASVCPRGIISTFHITSIMVTCRFLPVKHGYLFSLENREFPIGCTEENNIDRFHKVKTNVHLHWHHFHSLQTIRNVQWMNIVILSSLFFVSRLCIIIVPLRRTVDTFTCC